MAKNNKESYEQVIENILSFKHLDNSYKLLWMKSLLTHAVKGRTKLTFEQVAIGMLAHGWELVLCKNLTLGRLDKTHRILEGMDEKWQLDEMLSVEEAMAFMESLPKADLEPMLVSLYEETVYRFLEPAFEKQLKGKKESVINALIEGLTNEDKTALYKIDRPKKTIVLNSGFTQYLKKEEKKLGARLQDITAYYLDKNAGKR